MIGVSDDEPILVLRRNRIMVPVEQLESFEAQSIDAHLEFEIAAIQEELKRLRAVHPIAAAMPPMPERRQ